MTVEEFQALPIDDGPVYTELRHGEDWRGSREPLEHHRLPGRLRHLLQSLAPDGSFLEQTMAFRITRHGSPALRGLINPERAAAVDPEDHEKLCRENGALEFWVVAPARNQVKVSTPDGKTVTRRSRDQIPLAFFGGSSISVDAMFTA